MPPINKIGRITAGAPNTITEFLIPTGNSFPPSIAPGPDGNLWFTEGGVNQIGRITPSAPNTITEFLMPTANSFPYSIAAGPDGNLWFTEYSANQIGRVELAPAVTFSPTSVSFGSQPVGTQAVQTVTVSNGGGRALAVSSVTYTGTNPGRFSTAADTCTGVAVPPGGNCAISVKFSPAATGPRSALLTVADNAPGSPQTVPLSGVGAPSADLGIRIGASPNPVRSGKLLTYSIAVQNLGPTAATGVTVSDTLPSASQFSTVTSSQGTCQTPPVGSTGTMTCSLGRVANGATARIKVVVRITALAPSTVSDTASVTSGVFDPNSRNNSATVAVSVR